MAESFDGEWETDPATKGLLDKAGVKLPELMANLDEQIRRQEAAKPNNLNNGVFWGPFTKILLAIGLFILLNTVIVSWCQRRSEEYRTKYALQQRRKKLRAAKAKQQGRGY